MRFGSADAPGHAVDIGGLDLAAVFLAKQIFEQNRCENGRRETLRDALFFQRGKAENAILASATRRVEAAPKLF